MYSQPLCSAACHERLSNLSAVTLSSILPHAPVTLTSHNRHVHEFCSFHQDGLGPILGLSSANMQINVNFRSLCSYVCRWGTLGHSKWWWSLHRCRGVIGVCNVWNLGANVWLTRPSRIPSGYDYKTTLYLRANANNALFKNSAVSWCLFKLL